MRAKRSSNFNDRPKNDICQREKGTSEYTPRNHPKLNGQKRGLTISPLVYHQKKSHRRSIAMPMPQESDPPRNISPGEIPFLLRA